MIENLLELVDIQNIEFTEEYKNMVDIAIEDDESFILANGIISHNSAAGSVKQARDSEIEGVYALKGKIKNTKKLRDLAENKEILEIMSILGIDPSKENPPTYQNIIIAADEDPDGQHIASLIINFLHKWFPYIIKEKRVFKFVTPLVVCDYHSERKYFYSMDEFQEFSKNKKLSGVNYLKGLGSLSMEDWQWVMANKILFNVVEDRSAKKFLDIAFGDSSEKRKKWLEKGGI
jgi:DNA topoisomerase-2